MSTVVLATVHPVRDFASWKDAIDAIEHDPAAGVVGRWVYQSVDDPNEVMIVLQMASLDHAKALLPTFGMRDMLDRAGVEIYPAVFLGAEVDDLRRLPERPGPGQAG